MRFTEITSPEDQLALWRLISNKVWDSFAQTQPQDSAPLQANASLKAASSGVSIGPNKPLVNSNARPVKKAKHKKAPIASAPKPLPKPRPIQPTLAQTRQAQSLQNQQLANQIHQALIRKPVGSNTPKTIQPTDQSQESESPMNSGTANGRRTS